MNYAEQIASMLRSVQEGLIHAELDGYAGTPEYGIMVKQERTLKKTLHEMVKYETKAEALIGGRRNEKLTCEDPDSYIKKK